MPPRDGRASLPVRRAGIPVVFKVEITSRRKLYGGIDDGVFLAIVSLKASISIFVTLLGVSLLSYAEAKFSANGRLAKATDSWINGLWLISVLLSLSGTMVYAITVISFLWELRVHEGWKDGVMWMEPAHRPWWLHFLYIGCRSWWILLVAVFRLFLYPCRDSDGEDAGDSDGGVEDNSIEDVGYINRENPVDGASSAVGNNTAVGNAKRSGQGPAFNLASDFLFIFSPAPLAVGLLIFVWSEAPRALFGVMVFISFLTSLPWLWRYHLAAAAFHDHRDPAINSRTFFDHDLEALQQDR